MPDAMSMFSMGATGMLGYSSRSAAKTASMVTMSLETMYRPFAEASAMHCLCTLTTSCTWTMARSAAPLSVLAGHDVAQARHCAIDSLRGDPC